MVNQFSRLLNIRQDELRRIVVFSIMTVFFIIGYVWANIAIIASFISSLGDNSSSIAALLIGDAVIIVATFAVYSGVADRFANHRIMAGLSFIGIIGIVLGFILLQFSASIFNSETIGGFVSLLFLYLVFRSVGEAISTHWGPLINDYFDTRAAKRIFTLLGAVTRLSYVIAALSVTQFNTFGSANNDNSLIYLGLAVWAVTLVGMFFMSASMPRLMGMAVNRPQVVSRSGQKKGYWQNLYEGYQFAFKSHYLRSFVAASILMMLVLGTMQFEILDVLREESYSETQISDFLSGITLWGSILLLPFQLFAFNRLLAWAGVEKVNLIFPSTTLLTVVALAVIPFSAYADNILSIEMIGISATVIIVVVMLAEFNRTILNIGIRAINDEFLYNAVPVRVKGRIRGFISGIVEPFGTLLAGLLVIIPITDSPYYIPLLLVMFGVGYLLTSLWVSRQYGRALIEMIEEENFSFMLQSNTQIMIDSDTILPLENRLLESDDDDTKLLMARLLIEARGADYIPMLIAEAENGSKYLRAGIVDTFVTADLRQSEVIDLCVRYITDSNSVVRKSAITGLKQLVGVTSERYLLAALEVLNDADSALVAEVLPDLISTKDFYFLQQATESLNELLESDDPQERATGVRILGKTDSPRVLLLLLRYLIDRAQVVRLQAVIAIENLALSVKITDELVQALSITISSLLRDPLDRIRVSAVKIIERLHPDDFAERIMPALLDDSLEVRETAVDLLVNYPKETTRTFRPMLDSGNDLINRMSAAVLVRLNKNHEPRIYEHIDNILRDVYTNINRVAVLESLNHYAIISVVQNILAEQNEQTFDEIFYLLGSIHGEEAVTVAVEALYSSVPRTRANGVEALDVMLNLNLLEGIELATRPDANLDELVAYGRKTYKIDDVTVKDVLSGMLDRSNEDWMVYIGIEVMRDLGQQLYELNNAPSEKASPLDLLANFNDEQAPVEKETDIPFTLEEISALLENIQKDLPFVLQTALRKARNAINGIKFERSDSSYGDVISEIERIIFLKQVEFFHDVTINQLRRIATVCQEVWYSPEDVIFSQGSKGGSLFVIVEGRVGIERTEADGKSARLNTLHSEASFGEDTLFDESRTTTTAIALSRTLVLRLDHMAFMSLIQSYPDMSLKIIRVLSQQIRQIDTRVTSMTRQESDAENLFNKLDF